MQEEHPMTFNGNGYLDPGLHPMRIDEVEATFVSGFPHSSTRPAIMGGYFRHYEQLKALVGSFEQLVDGSFVSNKNDPGDIDLVCFVDAEKLDSLRPEEQLKFKELVSGKETRAKYHCDAYLALTFPPEHPNFSEARTLRKYWMGEFGYDRTDIPKGIVFIEERAPLVGGLDGGDAGA
jgi:hypothetical protein